jgi:TPR repeat protein
MPEATGAGAAEDDESVLAPVPTAAVESLHLCFFELRYATMVNALFILQSSLPPFKRESPNSFVGLLQAKCLSNVSVHRLRAIGGAAVALLAMRLALVACGPFVKRVHRGATRIVHRIAAKQAFATPEHLVWQGQCLYEVARYACAAERWQRAVEIGHPLAHALLANILIDGRPGLPYNRDRAFLLASAGARLGCAHSKGVLGRCYSGSYGVAQNIVNALALAQQSAAAGSCFGNFVLGVCYEKGEGVDVDMAKAAGLWRRAAEDGLAVAQFNLGVLLKLGKDVAQNVAEALHLWKLASSQGHAPAQTSLAYMFYSGDVADGDKCEAARLWRSAAEQGRAVAQFNLGHMLLAGDGVAQDTEEALLWLRRAALQGDRNAMMELARLGQPRFLQAHRH